MQIKFANIVLADTGDADAARRKPSGPSGLRISGSRAVQVDELVRGEHIAIRDRKNRATTITFTATHQHRSYGEAEEFCVLRNEELPVKGELVILMPKNGATAIKRTAADAAIVSVESHHVGVQSIHTYQIVCGELS